MRREIGAAPAPLFVDLMENRNDAIGHQIYQVGSCRDANPWVWMIEQDRKRCPAGTDRIQCQHYCVHEAVDLRFTFRVQQLIMKTVRKLRTKFKASEKGCGAFSCRLSNAVIAASPSAFSRSKSLTISIPRRSALPWAVRSCDENVARSLSSQASSLTANSAIETSTVTANSGEAYLF
jgi:hypothetical protein